MTLLEEIQKEAIDATNDLGALLRKCKLLAARLCSQPLEDWLVWESNGYPDYAVVPEYRIWQLEVKGHFSGWSGSEIRNAPVPLLSLPENVRQKYQYYECRLSIASIETALQENDSGIIRVGTSDLAALLGGNVWENHNCVQAWAEFGTTCFVELRNTVRNRILDFALAVWKEEPTAGEPSSRADSVIEPSQVTNIFNTIVSGGSASFVGSANDSSVEFTIVQNDFATLKRVLSAKGVSDQDIDELKTALDTDELPTKGGGFGTKVSSWIAGMTKKAADGSWGIGLGAAGSLLARVIGKYFGL